MERPRLLVTGASGQVGGELIHTLAPLGAVLAPSRAELDLADPASLRAYLRATRPRWIVNAGAYTAVDRAESEADLAYAINAEAPRILGEEAKTWGAVVLHFSTDYVFDGLSPRPYIETDPTGPLSVYGASKLAGEEALAASGADALIFRTSWVYGATGKNFLRTILKMAREREELRIVGDQHGAPTWSRDLARMVAHVVARCEREASLQTLKGIYHAGGSGETTWAGFAAEAIRRLSALEPSRALADVTPIPTEQYPTPAHRPRNSRLDTQKLCNAFDWTMMDWRDSLSAVLPSLGVL